MELMITIVDLTENRFLKIAEERGDRINAPWTYRHKWNLRKKKFLVWMSHTKGHLSAGM